MPAEPRAAVNKIIPFSSVDGPGNRTAVFLQSCGFRCLYCHNPETIHSCIHCGACLPYCKTGALRMENGRVTYDPGKCVFCDACFRHCPHDSSPRIRELTAAEVMAEVKKNMPFIRGVTVSGGECTRHRDFLCRFLPMAKEAGLTTLLDSNGSYDFSLDPELMSVTDGVMLDVKAWRPEEHKKVTGQGNETVLKNLDWLARQKKLTEVRTVVVPELFRCEETVEAVSRLLAERDSLETRYKIICYRPMGVSEQYRYLTPPSGEFLRELADRAKSFGLRDVVII